MQNILIIKTGAAGDVVRTTSLLNILKGKAVSQRAGKIFCIVLVYNCTILVNKAAIDIMLLQQRVSGIETNAEHTALFSTLRSTGIVRRRKPGGQLFLKQFRIG